MSDGYDQQKKLIDTTDCLEAISVFKGWKNCFFIILILGLLFIQAAFWLVSMGKVKIAGQSKAVMHVIAAEAAKEPNQASTQSIQTTNLVTKAAKEAAADSNRPVNASPQQHKSKFELPFTVTESQMTQSLRVINFLLIAASILYCLTILFSLKVSLLGRFGGINHISRALFLSMLFLVFFLPWQRFFAGMFVGYLFTPKELFEATTSLDKTDTFGSVLFYLRFTGYWLLVLVLLVLAQWRSYRWAKTILRRLEVV